MAMSGSRTVDDLLASARRSLAQASMADTAGERYAAAHLAALRAAAAVLAARSQPQKGRSRVRSVWVLLPQAAAEFAEWAAFFEASAAKRAAAEAGVACVASRDADDLARSADEFVADVCAFLNRPYQRTLADALAG
jgi:hypothetical protein